MAHHQAGTDAPAAAPLSEGEQHAVDESLHLLDERWTAWCVEHGLDRTVRPRTATPVVYQVGLDALEWVALIRFDVDVAGQHLRGMVRGPAGDAVFTVQRQLPQDEVGQRSRRAWHRKRAA